MNNESNSPKKLNITIIRIVETFYPVKGGSVTHQIELINAINPCISQQILIAPKYDNSNSDFDKKFCIPIIRLRSELFPSKILNKQPLIPVFNLLFFSFNSILAIRKIISQEKNKNKKIIIHVHHLLLGQFLLIFSKIFLLKLPMVIINHASPTYIASDTIRPKIMRKITYFLLTVFKPDYYQHLNDGTIDQRFVDFLQKEKINSVIVNHGIDTEFFKPKDYSKKDDEFIILSHHRLDNFKRIDLSIKIFKCFMNKVGYNQQVRLKIVGNGPQCQELKKLASSLNLNRHITFCGEKNIEDIKNEIDSSDIVIGTSLVSNINRSVLEAMSCRKPVIIFKSGNIDRSFVTMENIILVTPENIEEFADKIKLLWENRELREKIGNNARNVIISHRTWDRRIQQEIEVSVLH
jgi:glycosyltransferase involved in cell wall biosynthesis